MFLLKFLDLFIISIIARGSIEPEQERSEYARVSGIVNNTGISVFDKAVEFRDVATVL